MRHMYMTCHAGGRSEQGEQAKQLEQALQVLGVTGSASLEDCKEVYVSNTLIQYRVSAINIITPLTPSFNTAFPL